MKTRDFIVAILFSALLGGAYFALNSGEQKAPKVSLIDVDNNTITVPTSGKFSLVTFWATTCIGCQNEVPHLKELQTQFGNDKLNITAVAMYYDPAEQVANFRHKRELNYPIVLDEDGEVAKIFGEVNMTPTTYLIDENGTILYHKVGEFDTEIITSHISGG